MLVECGGGIHTGDGSARSDGDDVAREDWTDELDFIRRWRGDDPWGRAARRSRSLRTSADAEAAPPPLKSPVRRRNAFPLFENSAMSFAPALPRKPADGPRIDFEGSPGSSGRLILSDPAADRSIRTAFPRAGIDFPGGEYCRIIHPLGPGIGEDPELSRLPARGLLFDLETLGFHGRPLFLIGILYPDRDSGSHRAVAPDPEVPADSRAEEWRVVQLLARDYAEEEAILRAFSLVAGEQEPWVSFNGKAFDLPFLRDRARFHHLALPEPQEHRDLLHAARRVYRGVLPNCRLQTLEAALFARYRHRDLPGEEIPSAYHDYVRTGEEEDMVRILRHNRDDLVTLARLHVHLSA